jgi:hypothetical protein
VSEQKSAPVPVMALAWVWVGAPFAWGVYELILKVQNLFGS